MLCDLGQITSSAEPYSFLICKIVITLLYSCICFHTMFSSGNTFKYLWFLLIGYFHSHSWISNVPITYCLSGSGTLQNIYKYLRRGVRKEYKSFESFFLFNNVLISYWGTVNFYCVSFKCITESSVSLNHWTYIYSVIHILFLLVLEYLCSCKIYDLGHFLLNGSSFHAAFLVFL